MVFGCLRPDLSGNDYQDNRLAVRPGWSETPNPTSIIKCGDRLGLAPPTTAPEALDMLCDQLHAKEQGFLLLQRRSFSMAPMDDRCNQSMPVSPRMAVRFTTAPL
jgi:primosomal protein N'